jgi:hypothetical protein
MWPSWPGFPRWFIKRANEVLREIESETGNRSSGWLEERQKVIEVHPIDHL